MGECGGNSDEKEGDMSLDSSFTSMYSSESLYIPIPQKRIRDNFPIIPIPNKMCFLKLHL